MSTFDELKKIIVDLTGSDEDRIRADASLTDDLGLDSLDVVQLVMDVEDAFGVEIEDEAMNAIDTVQDAVSAVDHALSARGTAA